MNAPPDGAAPRPGQAEATITSDHQSNGIDGKNTTVNTIPASGPTYSISLQSQHAAALAASGISPEFARRRGYVSVDTKARLESIGITGAGRRVPGLLVPSRRQDGSVWGYQYRPDEPRLRDSKPVKYETPVRQRNGLDVPPGVGDHLDDPLVPLWITEGVKKADCGAQRGLCITALPGVWAWLGTNTKGGKTVIPDLRDVALNGRTVILAFDSDVVVKPAVRKALTEFAAYLKFKGASVEYCHLPDDGDGKTGLDDYLVAGHTTDDLMALVHPDPPEMRIAPDEPLAPLAPVSQGHPVQPIVGHELLDQMQQWLARYISTLHPIGLDVLALWAAHTHLVQQTYTTPRLILDSPVHGSGKTTTLEHLHRLCFHPVQMAALSSPALLTRMLDTGMRTVLIDEADRSLSPDVDGVGELLAVLNSGYKRGATRPVLIPDKNNGWTAKEMPTFAPVAMAGNNPRLPDDTRSRAIRVVLMPADDCIEESDWEWIEKDADALGQEIATWADQVRDQVVKHRPVLPPTVTGRARERWGPLKRVAEAAGGRWPAVVDALAARDVELSEQEREEGIVNERPAVALLRHMHDTWPEETAFVETEKLINQLTRTYPEAWGLLSPYGKALTPQRMGRMLAQAYDVRSTRMSRDGQRGYTFASFATPWRRMGITRAQETGASGAGGSTGASLEPDREPAVAAVAAVARAAFSQDASVGARREPECGMCGATDRQLDERGICDRGDSDHEKSRGWLAHG